MFKNAYKKVCLKVGTVGTNLAFYCTEHSLTLDIESNFVFLGHFVFNESSDCWVPYSARVLKN